MRKAFLVAALFLGMSVGSSSPSAAEQSGQERPALSKILSLDRVIAFYGEPRELSSATFVLSRDWRYWKNRGAALFCSSLFAAPNYYPGHLGPEGAWEDWGLHAEPETFRVLMMNLGLQRAENVIVKLRSPGPSGDVFAKGIVDIPGRSIAVATLPVQPGKTWDGWQGSWAMEVEAGPVPVFIFWDARRAAGRRIPG